MNHSATIKLFLLFGDPKRLRIAELSNWSGIAIAAPRSDLKELLQREEVSKPGVYFLLGVDPENGERQAYVGEAESVKTRLKQHQAKEFWNSAIVFVSKDENLTKSHIRYLEGRLIESANEIAKYKLHNAQSSGAKLPESDLHDMEAFLVRMAQLLPVLGAEILTPVTTQSTTSNTGSKYIYAPKGARAWGERTPNGFAVFKGSTAVTDANGSGYKKGSSLVALRTQMLKEGAMVEENGFLVFKKDVEFTSPSAAASIIYGGTKPGRLAWKNAAGKTLKEVEESEE